MTAWMKRSKSLGELRITAKSMLGRLRETLGIPTIFPFGDREVGELMAQMAFEHGQARWADGADCMKDALQTAIPELKEQINETYNKLFEEQNENL